MRGSECVYVSEMVIEDEIDELWILKKRTEVRESKMIISLIGSYVDVI